MAGKAFEANIEFLQSGIIFTVHLPPFHDDFVLYRHFQNHKLANPVVIGLLTALFDDFVSREFLEEVFTHFLVVENKNPGL